MKKNLSKNKGFALLLAAVTAAIVLSLGSAIFEIAQKELTLDSIGRQSQIAFYAADSAAECALYWDFRYGYFATTTPSLPAGEPDCDGEAFTNTSICRGSCGGTYTDSFRFQAANGLCADVDVEKVVGSGGSVSTAITASGYDTSCNTIASNPQALQRSVELNY